MTTQNGVNTSLSGQTGTGNFVGSNSPGLTTPKIITQINDVNGNPIIALAPQVNSVNYVEVFNNISLNAPAIAAVGSDTDITLLLTGKGTGGIYLTGVSTNSNASAGQVGEIITSNIPSGSAVTINNNTATNITSIPLTAGDWDVYGNVQIAFSGVNTFGGCWISTTSATLPDSSLRNGIAFSASVGATNIGISSPFLRVIIASTTTVYLSAYSTYTTGTSTGAGTITARRAR